jgi:pimeloyl-ACP methyl ester carboxylesterase
VSDQTIINSEFVELRGVTFAYSDTGTGPVVLSAHGLSQSRTADAQVGLLDFSAVSANRRLISFDARGHGASSGTADAADYTWSFLADDLLALADHFSPHAPVSAIGCSMGTGTILHAVVKAPDRFDRLVLTAPPTAWDTRAGQTQMYSTMADMVEGSTPQILATLFAQAPVAPIFADVPAFPPTPDVAFDLLPTVFRGAGLSDLPDPDALRSITQPTLILPWATDTGHPVSTAQKLRDLISGSHLVVAQTSADIRTWGAQAAAFLG